jgi:cytochrome c
MKRFVILLLLAATLLPACGGASPGAIPTVAPTTAPTQAAEPTDTPVPQPTATPPPEEAIPTPEPSATAIVEEASPTPEPTSSPQPTATPVTDPVVVFRDDFEGALSAGWAWLRDEPASWNLTDSPGSLRITLQDGFIVLGTAKHVLLRDAPSGSFEIETFVRCTPTSNFQLAGLAVYQDDSNFLQFGRAFCDRPEGCVGNGVYFDNVVDGEGTGSGFGTVTASESQAHLRLRREADTYTAYYSEDGADWIVIGQHINSLTPSRVGVIAGQAVQVETTAEFEHFTVTALP